MDAACPEVTPYRAVVGRDVLGTEKVVNQIILQLRNCVNVIEVTSRRR